MKLSVIAAEAGSSGIGKSVTRGSIDATNQGESSRLLQSALKDRSKNGSGSCTNQKKSEVTLDVVQRRYSKDQKHHEEIERMSEEGEIKEEEDDERSDKSDEQNETVRREMEAKREKSHTTKRVEVLEDEAYI